MPTLPTVQDFNKKFIADNPEVSGITPTPPGSPEAAAAQQAKDMATYFPNTPVNASGVITADTLKGNPTPYNLPNTTTPSTTGVLGTTVNSTLAGVKTDANYTPPAPAPVDTTAAKKQSLFEKYFGTALSTTPEEIKNMQIAKQTAETAALEKKQKATAISTEADQMDKAYRDEIAQIKTNPEGKFGGALQAEINQATDRYQNNRANLALTYKVANDDYQGALDIVNSKVSALKDANDNNLNMYKLQVDAIMNDLSESEKTQVTANINQKTTDNKNVNDTYQTLLTNLATNKATSIIPAIDQIKSDYTMGKITADQALSKMTSAAGQNGTNTLDTQYKQGQISIQNAQLEALNIKNKQDKEVLSISEAKSLGVPYGTTKAQAIALGKVPGGSTLTAAQSSALGYANRTVEADKIINELGSKFTGIGSYLPTASIFGINLVPNALKSDDRQMFEQAQRNFVNAVLRRESGAAISPSEFDNAALQYFPQPGDSEAVIKQKANNRSTTIDGLLISAGQPLINRLANTASQTEIDYVKSLNIK